MRVVFGARARRPARLRGLEKRAAGCLDRGEDTGTLTGVRGWRDCLLSLARLGFVQPESELVSIMALEVKMAPRLEALFTSVPFKDPLTWIWRWFY